MLLPLNWVWLPLQVGAALMLVLFVGMGMMLFRWHRDPGDLHPLDSSDDDF